MLRKLSGVVSPKRGELFRITVVIEGSNFPRGIFQDRNEDYSKVVNNNTKQRPKNRDNYAKDGEKEAA